MQDLMGEKEKLNLEQEKIKKNKFLKLVDKNNAIKSVRSLSRTIDNLIIKEKDKIEDHFKNSILIEKSRASIQGASEEEDGDDDHLKVSTLNKLVNNYNNRPSPGGTTDSLAFSQSIALSNMAATMKERA